MFLRAIICTIFIFALMVGGFFLLPAPRPYQDAVLPDVSVTLIDAVGDANNIKPGSITSPCISTLADGITDQFYMLKQKIHNYPGTTYYENGVYVTFSANERRPIFQIRYPTPAYCSTFVEAYRSCFASADQGTTPLDLAGAIKGCIKTAAKALKVTEDWSGMLKAYTPKPN